MSNPTSPKGLRGALDFIFLTAFGEIRSPLRVYAALVRRSLTQTPTRSRRVAAQRIVLFQKLFQIFSRQGFGIFCDLFRRAGCDNFSAVFAAVRAKVNYPIG